MPGLLARGLILAQAAVAAASSANAPLAIEVGNVRNDRGVVRVSVCPKARFLADSCPYEASAPAHTGTTRVVVAALPPGDYAVQAFHDENANNEIDRGLFGIPKEGVGFSRDARITLGPPKWRDAAFTHGSEPQTISFSLRYFLGASGPRP